MVNLVTGDDSQITEGVFALSRPAVRIAPSLLAADFSQLADEVERIEKAGAEVLHLDVMDGHFVPNISFGPGVIAALRRRSAMFFDAHLMIEEPLRYAEAFAKAGSDLITFHIEAADSPGKVIAEIKRLGKAVGVAINPGTEVSAIEAIVPAVDLVLVMSVWPGFGGQEFMKEVLPKLRELRRLLAPHQRLEVDGGIDSDTIVEVVRAGADTIVAGTSVFGQDDPPVAWDELKRRALAAITEGALMGELVLIPWAETDWSAKGRLAAAADLPLNANGVARAAEWGDQLAAKKLRIVFTSDELTSRQTAETVAHASKARVKSMKGLEEVSLGLWEGLTEENLKARFPKVYKRWLEDPTSVCVPEGEDLPQAAERIYQSVRRAMRKAGGQPIGVVLGSMACAVVRCEFEDVNLATMRSLLTSEPVWYDHDLEKKKGQVPSA